MSRLFAVSFVAGVHAVSAGVLKPEALVRQCGEQTRTAALKDMSADTRQAREQALTDACTNKAGNDLTDCKNAYYIKTYGYPPNYAACEDAFDTEPSDACLEVAIGGMEGEQLQTSAMNSSPSTAAANEAIAIGKALVEWFISPPASAVLASNAREVFRICQNSYGSSADYCSRNNVGTKSPAWTTQLATCQSTPDRNLKTVEVYGPRVNAASDVTTHFSAVVFKYVEGPDVTYGDTAVEKLADLKKQVLTIPVGVFVSVAEASVNPSKKRLCKLKIVTTDGTTFEATADATCQPSATPLTGTFYSRAPNDFKVDSKDKEDVYPTGFSYASKIPKEVCKAKVKAAAQTAMSYADKAAITKCQALFQPGPGEGCFGLGTTMSTLQLQEVMDKCNDAACKAFLALHFAPPPSLVSATEDSLHKCQALFGQKAACALPKIKAAFPPADATKFEADISTLCVPASDTSCTWRAWSYHFFRLTKEQQNNIFTECFP